MVSGRPKYEVWYLRQLLQGIGWVGKDEVILLLARFDEAEGIGTENPAVVHHQLSIVNFFDALAYKSVVVAVKFYAGDVGAAT